MGIECDDAQFAMANQAVSAEIAEHVAACDACTFYRQVQAQMASADPALDATVASDAPDATSGERLPRAVSGRYQVGPEIGRGALGRVLQAHDAVLDRTIAIKEILGGDDASRRRFVREALITARLQHPAIVSVYDAARWDERAPFYAMKLVAGRSLADALGAATDLAARLALVPTVLAVADAIAYAHSQRIIHRDLKPSNVMVGEFGETVVIDWGLAKDLSIDDRDAPDDGPYRAASADRTAADSLLGTPAYMAPEQAARKEVDERADVYALGAMLYQVVSGHVPHQGKTRDEVIDQVIAGHVTPVAKREPRTPVDLAAIVSKAMANAPAERYPSARELADDLRRFVSGQLVAVHRYSLRELVRRWASRHRIALLVSAIATAVLAGYGTWSVRRIVAEQRVAAHERDRAVAQANGAVLAQARAVMPADAAEALRVLITLSPSGPGWDAARVIAADALSRPRVVVTASLRQNARPPIEDSKWTVDAVHGRAYFWSWGDLWIVDLATGAVRPINVKRPVWPDVMLACEDGKRLVGWNERTGGAVGIVELDVARDAPDERTVDAANAQQFLAACRRDFATATARASDLWTPPAERDPYVVSAPDGSWTAIGNNQRLVWRNGPGLEREEVLLDEPIESLEVSPDGQWLIARATSAYAWNMEAGAWKLPLGDRPAVAAAWVGGDRAMTRDRSGTVRVWELPAPRMLVPYPGSTDISRDGRWIVDEGQHGLRRTDASGQVPAETTAWPVSPIQATTLRPGAIAPSGDVIAWIENQVWVWRRDGRWESLGQALGPAELGEVHVEWTRDGAPMAWASHEIVTWEQGHARRIAPFEVPAVRRLLSVRDDLKFAAALDTINGDVVLVDLVSRTERPLPGSAGASNQDRVGFSKRGGHLVTGSADVSVDEHLVWDLASSRARPVPRSDADPASIELSDDGQRAAIGGPDEVVIIDGNGARYTIAAPARVTGLWFDDVGDRLVIATRDGAELWDVRAGNGRPLVGEEPQRVHFDADGVTITVATYRGVYRFTDDLPAEPCALLIRLGASCSKR